MALSRLVDYRSTPRGIFLGRLIDVLTHAIDYFMSSYSSCIILIGSHKRAIQLFHKDLGQIRDLKGKSLVVDDYRCCLTNSGLPPLAKLLLSAQDSSDAAIAVFEVYFATSC